MKLVRLATCAALAGSLLVVGTSQAAAPKLAKAMPVTFTDATGDANFSNDSGGLLPVAPPSSGSSVRAGADIVSVTLGRTDDGKVVKTFTVDMKLAAPAEQSTQYRVAMSLPDCTTYYVEYQFPPTGAEVALTKGGLVRENCTGKSVFTGVDAQLVGNDIIWTIPVKGAPGSLKLGSVLSLKYAQTNLETVAVVPAFDQAAMTGTFKVGQ